MPQFLGLLAYMIGASCKSPLPQASTPQDLASSSSSQCSQIKYFCEPEQSATVCEILRDEQGQLMERNRIFVTGESSCIAERNGQKRGCELFSERFEKSWYHCRPVVDESCYAHDDNECTDEYEAPTYCYLEQNGRVHIAKSECLARKSLQRDLCLGGQRDQQKKIQCHPYLGPEECLERVSRCPLARGEIFQCEVADATDGYKTVGSSECEARSSLVSQMCANQLPRQAFEQINCVKLD